MAPARRPRLKRRLLAAGIAVLHLLLVFGWRTGVAPQERADAANGRIRITYVTAARAARAAAPVAAPEVKAAPRRPRSAGRFSPDAAPSPVPAPLEAPAAAAPMAADTAAAPTDSVLLRAKQQLAAIDRDLRKASLNPADRVLANGQTFLAKAIDRAHRPINTTFEELSGPDGRRITKVHSPYGTYCMQKQSNSLTGGRDPFLQPLETRTVPCPGG